MGGTDTGTTVLNRRVRNGEFSEVVSDHLGFDFNLVENLSGVDSDDRADHLGNNDHVTEMGLDDVGLLVGFGFLLGLSEFLDQAHWAALEAAVEPSAGAGVDDFEELFGGQVEEAVEIDSSVREFAEGSSLLELSSVLSVVFFVSHGDGCG